MAFEVDPRTLLNKLAFGPSDAELYGVAKTGTDGWLASSSIRLPKTIAPPGLRRRTSI